MNETVPAAIPTLGQAWRYYVRLVVLLRAYWGAMLRSFLLGVVITLLGLVPPLLTKLYLDEVYPTGDAGLLRVLVLGGMVLMVTWRVTSGIRAVVMQHTMDSMTGAAQVMFFNHVQHQPVRFFDARRVGEVLSRNADVRLALQTVSRTVESLLGHGTTLLLVPPFLLWLSGRLTCVALLPVPVLAVISLLSGCRLRELYKEAAEHQAEQTAVQNEALLQIRTLKLATAEHAVYHRVRQLTAETIRLQWRSSTTASTLVAARGVVSALGAAVLTWYAWTLILRGELTVGDFMAFSAYAAYVVGPVTQVSSLVANLQQSAVALGRMFEYLDSVPEMSPFEVLEGTVSEWSLPAGDIEIRDVSFAYPAAAQNAVTSVSLTLPRTGVAAIIGPSGAGKSSLLRLLCRFDDPSAGVVLIGGSRISDFPLRAYRQAVTAVWQETGLFKGTLMENVTLGNPTITRRDVERVLAVCQLEDLVASLPQGIDGSVAELGTSLSGGQRQRLAIARALVRRPDVLVLDEATANIDVRTEADVLAGVLREQRGRLVVIVSHRPSTISCATHVVVLERGRVVAAGDHDRVSGQSAFYRSMMDSAVRSSHSGGLSLQRTGQAG